LVFATVGTDHHPFHRLVEWVDGWFAHATSSRAQCFVQHGTSAAPRFSDASRYVRYEEVQRLMGDAAVVVSHGGPATIMECRALGAVPIVVPRRADLGEHVDEHQTDFCNRLAASGDIVLCDSDVQLRELLDRAIVVPDAFRSAPMSERSPDVVRRFGELVDQLVASGRRHVG
jgi:UDP-N-acetylglucosamine transferase subunit ALG13